MSNTSTKAAIPSTKSGGAWSTPSTPSTHEAAASAGLARPEPAEGPGGHQPIDEPVDHRPDGHAPVAAPPDRVLRQGERVTDECDAAHDLKHLEIVRAGFQRGAGDVRRKERDHN